MKRKTLISIIATVVVVLALIIYSAMSGKEKEVVLETEVQYGTFEIAVMITGELQAIRETEIQAPSSLRSRHLRIHRVKIQDLIPEGTVVDEGGILATGMEEAEEVLDETYLDGYVAHSPMEPLTALAVVENGKMKVWASTQNPFGLKSEIARELGLKE